MATLVITVVTTDTDAMITDQLQGVGTITDPEAIGRIARYINGLADGAFYETSVTTAVS
jgi:hypothetical protein